MADMNSLLRNPAVLGAGFVVVIGAAVAAGYFLGSKKPVNTKAAAAAALANRSVCEATLARTATYGILDSAAQLTSKEASTTDTKDRMVCTAQAGGDTYTITVDVSCNDMSNAHCLKLYKVADSNGAVLFQRTQFLPPQ